MADTARPPWKRTTAGPPLSVRSWSSTGGPTRWLPMTLSRAAIFRRPTPSGLLAATAGGAAAGHAKAAVRRQQEPLGRVGVHLALPADPGVLHYGLGASHLSRHPVAEGAQRGATRFERCGAVDHASP